MRAFVDFSQIPLNRTGVGVYAENLVRELAAQLTSPDTLFVVIQKDEERIPELIRHYANVETITLPSILFRNRIVLLIFEQLLLPLLLLWKKANVVHSLHYTHPLVSPCPRVITVHDLTFLLYPELHTIGRRLVMPFFLKHAIRHAEAIIFDSEATRYDAERLIPTKDTNLRKVVPLGVDLNGFIIDMDTQKSALRRLSISQPFVLSVGTIEPRKNFLGVIRSFEQIADRYTDLLLVIAGKPGWHYDSIFAAISASRHKNRIIHLGFVAEPDKVALLAACELLVYPSFYEGFGLPILEAMAAGAPVITSNISSLPEVAGDAAALVDPHSIEEITTAIQTLLTNKLKRADLRRTGKLRAATFNWAITATQTQAVYKAVASNPSSRPLPS